MKTREPEESGEFDWRVMGGGLLVLFVGAWSKKLITGYGVSLFEAILLFLGGASCVHWLISRKPTPRD